MWIVKVALYRPYTFIVLALLILTVSGATMPSPCGGKQRHITVNMSQIAMQSKGIAPGDILNALAQPSVVMPSGTIDANLEVSGDLDLSAFAPYVSHGASK
jgi:multidrug efflux pump subunit AcrB